jgi:hypothetical protein
MKKIICEFFGSHFCREISINEYTKGEFYIAISNIMLPTLKSFSEGEINEIDNKNIKKLVFRKDKEDVFRLIGYKD